LKSVSSPGLISILNFYVLTLDTIMIKSVTILNKISEIKNRYQFDPRWFLDLLELFTVIICIPIAHLITFYFFNTINYSWELSLSQSAIFSIIFIFSWYVLSQVSTIATLPREQRYLNAAFLYARGYFFMLLFLIGIKLVFPLSAVPVFLVLMMVLVTFTVTLAIRLLTIRSLRVYRASGYNLRNVVVIGDECSSLVIHRFLEQKDWGFNISAIITQSPVIKRKYGKEIPTIPGTENIEYILESQVVDEVFYCKNKIDEGELRRILRVCDEIGVVFRVQSSFSNLEPFEVQIKTMNANGNHTLVDIPQRKLAFDIKTISDITFSLIALILLSPILAFLAIIIKLDSRGPVFYKQERVGLRGRKFMLYKFRTMVADAEKRLEQLKAKNEMDGPTFKMKNDPRITRLGRFLRKTGIDEFPQLINVVKGEMSLIGPRPPIEAEVKQYERWQLRRLSVKPGITCTWQIMPHRNDIKFDKWMLMDLNYIDNWSLSKDFKLYFKTITAMLFATGR